MMRALVYSRASAGGVAVSERARRPAAPREGHVLVDVVAAGLNPVDAKYLVGDKLPSWLDALVGRRSVEGLGAGFDFAGVVACAGAGAGAQLFAPDDRVFGTSPIGVASVADVVEVPAHQVAHMPRGASFARAAALPLVGLTALQALRHNGLACGKRLLLIGASGGVGHVALQVAKAMGAHVTAVAGTEGCAMAEALGADATVDYTASASPAELRAALVRASGGAPFDLCLDTVTSKDGVDAAWAYPLVVSGGAIDGADAAGGPAAGPPGAKAGARPPVPLLAGRYVTIGGSFADWLRAGMGKVLRVDPYGAERALFWIRFPRTRGELEELARMVEDGELSPVVAREVPFDSASVARAVEELLARRTKGKLVVRIRSDLGE